MYQVIAQAVGFVGAGLNIASYQCKTSHRLFLLQLLGNLVYTTHFFLLGAYTGCISLAISFCGNAILYNNGRRWANWRGWKWVFAALYIAATILTWKDLFSLLPCAAMLTANFTNWSRNGRVIRLGRLAVVSPGWLIYDIYTLSYSGILCETLCLCSILLSIRRYGMKALDQAG